MKKKSLYFVLSLLIIYSLFGFLIVPNILKKIINEQLKEVFIVPSKVKKVSFNPFTLTLSIHNLTIKKDDKKVISLNNAQINFSLFTSFHEKHINFQELILSDAQLNLFLNHNNKLNLNNLLKKQANTIQKNDKKTNNIAFKFNKIVLKNFNLNLNMEHKNKIQNFKIKHLNYTIYDFGTFKNILSSHKLQSKINNHTFLSLQGGLRLKPFKMYGNIDIKDFKAQEFIYLKNDLLNFSLDDSSTDISFGYEVRYDKNLTLKINDAQVNISDVSLKKNKQDLLFLKNIQIQNANYLYPQNKLLIDKIVLSDFSTTHTIDAQNISSFSNLIKKENKQLKAGKKEISTKNSNPPINVHIEDIMLLNINFKHDDINKAFKTDAKKISLNLHKVVFKDQTTQIQQSNLHINTLNLHNQKLNLKLKNFSYMVSKLMYKDNTLYIKESLLNKPIFSIVLKKVKEEQKISKKDNPKKDLLKDKETLNLNLGPVVLKEAQLNFEDKNLPIPFKVNVSKLNGDISELITSNSKPTKLKFQGEVNQYGYTKIVGEVDHNNVKKLSNVNVLFKNISIKNLSGYTIKFVGREIKEGKLEVNLKYNIKQSNLDAKNSIVIHNIKLGKNIKSKDAISLPLDLAIALLEDSNGVIDLKIPVKGNVDDPKFSLSPIIWKAFTNLITDIATAPFKFLASMLGIEEDQIKYIDFEFGQSTIIHSEKENLKYLEDILIKKPQIAIKLQPTYHEIYDKKALQEQKLSVRLLKLTSKDSSKKDDVYFKSVETLYKNLISKDLKKVQQQFKKEDKLNKKAYLEYLTTLLIEKESVSKKELEALANKRIDTILNYLYKNKKIKKESIQIIKNYKVIQDKQSDWTQFNVTISLKK